MESHPLARRARSFLHAFRGARVLVRTQANARIHLAATLAVMGAAVWCRVSAGEAVALTLAVALVWMAEALNTALEFLADEVSLAPRERIRHAKDVAACGVLAAALGAAGVGLLVFGPHLWRQLAG